MVRLEDEPTQSDLPDKRPVSTATSGRIPFTVRVGVTGHRTLVPDRLGTLQSQIDSAFERVNLMFPGTADTEVVYTAVSSLAEGADRLVGDAVLQRSGGRLEVVLPMRERAYLEDFASEDSRHEFRRLLRSASRVIPAPETRPEEELDPEERKRQYQWASRHVVDRCDILLALWDGKPPRGEGGTADTIRYALEKSVPVICVPTEGGEVIEDRGEGEVNGVFHATGFEGRIYRLDRATGRHHALPLEETRRSLEQLDEYNHAPKILFNDSLLAPGRFEREVLAETMHLPEGPRGVDLEPLIDAIRPYYVWADRRALFFQRWYTLGILTIFGAAATAVLSAALESIFDIGWFLIVESALLCSIGLVVYFGRRFLLHDQWINSRYLAERFRSTIFLKAAGVGGGRTGEIDPPSLRNESTDWLRRAYDYVWETTPDPKKASLEDLRAFLTERWIQPQIDYHVNKSSKHSARDSWLLTLSLLLFGVTVLLAMVHVADWVHSFAPKPLTNTIAVLATSLPAFGSAMAGVSAHLQYHRHAAVYAGMANQLESVKQRAVNAPTYSSMRVAAIDADEIMTSEQRDWLGVMRFIDLDVG